jgi:DNA-binding transcriptional LysR family regulator
VNLEHLKAFYVTVMANSISKAAKQLHLSQPALSMQLQALEKELDSELLIRSTKGVQLTEAGEVLYDYAKTILSLKENIQRDIKNIHKNQQLLLGACTTVGDYALPCSLFLFKDKNPDISVHVEISNTPGVITKLINHTVRIGIIQGKPPGDEMEYMEIMRDKLLLVVQPQFWERLSAGESNSITLEELKELPLIMREEGSGTRCYIEETLSEHGTSLDEFNIAVELNTPEAIKSSVTAGQGLSFVPEYTVKKELRIGHLKAIEVQDVDFTSHYYVAYLKDTKLRPHEKEFLDFLNSHKRGFC